MIQKISTPLNFFSKIIKKIIAFINQSQYSEALKSNLFKALILSLNILLSSTIAFSQSSNQEDLDKLFNRAYHYMSVDKQKSIELLTKCIKIDSSFANAYLHRGVAYFKLSHYDSALTDFKAAHNLKPDQSILYMYKGFSHRNMGNTEKALANFSRYISLNPTDTSAYSYILRGKLKYELGDFNGAVKDYDMAMKLEPFEEKYQYYRFVALFEAEQYKKALEAVNKLIQINSDFYGYYFYKGNIYDAMNNYDLAIGMYSIAIIKNYQNGDSYFHRAKSYAQLNQYEKAIEDFNTAILLKPNDGTYYSAKGNCLFEMGQKKKACENWNEAGALGYYQDFDKMKNFCETLKANEGKGD